MQTKGPKMLYLDLETTTNQQIIENYGLKLWYTRMSAASIARDWSILCASWKWVSGGKDKKVHNICVDSDDVFNDEAVVRKVWELINEASIVIGHNMAAFDLKKFNARAVYYGLPPTSPVVVIDTLKIARQNFAFTSNKLAYLAKFLGCDAKDTAPDWSAIIAGDAKELKRMVKYCNQDIVTGVEVYDRLKAWDKNHPNLNAYKEPSDKPACPVCGESEMAKNGTYTRKNGDRVQTYSCRGCGHAISENYTSKKPQMYLKSLKA